ncbi:heparan-alpha-glucosaminide N-acetyltransferase domain-containing protein [Nocardioides bruguierae]|uniref:heparan-alpha-glucosaminide N-acetyltransferase domain-containing protein n=1 Tax=Nocardioides bruguierae TaxID=2945102 RepID=UPI0020208D18|nr:heparan-alpha-glucosaminide N-acetyltransferase domain-containing protein [Nocardioides bruguierae]MCL8025261.1 heparan-alpha-glucosaminide N-acetyltransferase domain-containing protein [Nocardioides bruguierae]
MGERGRGGAAPADRPTGATPAAAGPRADRVGGPARLIGVDLARLLALLAMMATHLVSVANDDGTPSAVGWWFSGRASALFAVLAGVSLALLSGRTRPARGRAWARAAAGLLARALVVGAVGLVLGGLDSGIAVILVNYAVLFVLGALLVPLGARVLLGLALVWVVLGPGLLQVLRPLLPERGSASPSLDSLAEPGHLLAELLVTGYYPVVAWLAYLLLGMGIGRLDLARLRTEVLAAAAVGGAVVAALVTFVAHGLMRLPVVLDALGTSAPLGQGGEVTPPAEMLRLLVDTGMFGQTPADGSWAWLLVLAPHASTPPDLAATMASSVAVLAACLLLERGARAAGAPLARALAVLSGAGAATLSGYTVHVVLTTGTGTGAGAQAWAQQALLLVVLGAALAVAGLRGPLEAVAARLAAGARRLVPA